MRILGISAFYHDSAAALVVDGNIVAAAQEERFTRKKHDSNFPVQAVNYCLAAGGIGAGELDHVVFYEKPFVKFERLIETYVTFAPRGFPSFLRAMPLWLKEKLFLKKMLRDSLKEIDRETEWAEKLLFAEHHQSHAASAFYPSPFEEALILTMDGVGEWCTTSAAIGNRESIEIKKEIRFPHSLGLLYSAFTYHTGFKVNSGEYKVMGLAPYGTPRFVDAILDKLIDVRDDGSFALNLDYFDYCTGLTMTNKRFDALFGGPPRRPDQLLDQRHMDLAASIQAVTEIVVSRLATHLGREFGHRNLCLAGGVALNCVANGKLLRQGQFDNIWIQPAAGDAGGALGAALAAQHMHLKEPRRVRNRPDGMEGGYLGPAYDAQEIATALTAAGARFHNRRGEDAIEETSEALAAGKAVGWFQGRMEFGPRALGNRSILGDPRSPTMQKLLNLKVKYREVVPAVRTVGVARRRRRVVRLRRRQPLHAAGRRRSRKAAATDDGTGAGTVWHRQAQHHPLGNSGRHACRLFGPHPDRPCRNQSALSPAADGVQEADRLPRPRQYELQCPGGAHRVHPARCLSLLHGHGHRPPGVRRLRPPQGGPGPGPQARLRNCF